MVKRALIDLSEIVEDHGGRHRPGLARRGRRGRRHVAITGAGERLRFDALVIATGAIAREPLPGALTFRGRGDVPALRSLARRASRWPSPFGRVRGTVRSDVDAADLRAGPYDRGASTRARGRCRRGVARDARGGAARAVWAGGRGSDQAHCLTLAACPLAYLRASGAHPRAGARVRRRRRVVRRPRGRASRCSMAPGSRAFPATSMASSPSTATDASTVSITSTLPATSRRSRSSKVDSQHSRPTPWRRRSPQRSDARSSPGRSVRCCAGC